VYGDDAKASGIPADVWRYYLLANRPEGADTHFSWKDFQDKNNNELLANLGNFINRTLTFTQKHFDSKVPGAELESSDDKLISEVGNSIKSYIELLESVKERDALREVLNISRLGNQYFQENEPWRLIKDEETKKRCATVINVCCNLVRNLAILVEPFLPSTSKEIFRQLNLDAGEKTIEYKMHLDIDPGHNINEPKVLFRKLEDKEIKELKNKFAGKKKPGPKEKPVEKLDEFPLDLRVAKVEKVEDHPDAGKLYVVQVDLGTEKRQLVAGLKAYIPRENIIGKHIIVVCNLKPAKLRGIESNGMLLAADDGNKVVLLEASSSDPGDEVTVRGVHNVKEFRQLDIDEFAKIKLTVDEEGQIICENFKKKLKTAVEFVIAKGIGKGAKIR
ncbi:class I tRNA ligase family protein, partial [Candidatus Woesearchaeota archaeon]|nr:class I tRNA ligase family protein [Candidatus Woesearchaeota archaeon]